MYIRQKLGVLFRGRDGRARIEAYNTQTPALGFELQTVLPERAGDPLLQAALFYRMLQLNYDAVIIYPEGESNLAPLIRSAEGEVLILDVGAKTRPSLIPDAPCYHALPLETDRSIGEEVRYVLSELSRLLERPLRA
ncbi:MAG: hypothetical protein GX256_03775 [Fretibacterium sp.]|nr:hypothetical protein [Fretibacterium sp.]